MTAELMWPKFFWFVRAAIFNYYVKFLSFERKQVSNWALVVKSMQIFRKPSTCSKDILKNWDSERSEQQYEAWFQVLKLDSSFLIVYF